MKGRIYNACKTREPDTRYNATYKGLHRSLSTDDQLGAYVYKMIERVKDGRTNKNGETGVGKLHDYTYILCRILVIVLSLKTITLFS